MRYATEFGGAIASLLILGSCSSFDGVRDPGGSSSAPDPLQSPVTSGVADTPTKLGAPFTVGQTSYTPVDVANYDDVGYASFYGAELAGQPTANGETFNPAGITAAHKTLPLPTYVEVTALGTGRTILIRVNDRGPFTNDRLIDLSEGAARQLGITEQGVSGVRVRKVNPPEQERAVLREGLRAAERIGTPESLLRILRDKLGKQPKPAAVAATVVRKPSSPDALPTAASNKGRIIREDVYPPPRAADPERPAPSISPSTGAYVVQVAAFASRSRADSLAKQSGANVIASADGKLFRVRYGPYATEAEGKDGLADAKKRGYPDARLYRD